MPQAQDKAQLAIGSVADRLLDTVGLLLIALVGCYQGFKVSGGAEAVGRQTTVSVVQSIFLVIVVDAAFSVLFSWLKI